MQHRLLVIAISEATLDLIGPWAEAGRLPTLRRLMTDGAWGRLRSQTPPITPQLWSTLVTGRTPGHHGVFDFWQRGPDGRFREVNGAALQVPPIWTILSERRIPSAILNVPFTYPPARIEGFMISGEDAPGAHPSIATPDGLYQEVTRRFGRYRLKDIFPGGRQKSDYLGLIEEDVEKQTEVFASLLATRPWRFGTVFFSATAIAQHYFWADMTANDPANPYREVIGRAYEAIDRAIAQLCAAAGPQTQVFVVSECGAGPLYSGVQVNTLLEQHGFLRRKQQVSLGHSRRIVASARKNIQGALQRWLPDSTYYRVNHGLRGAKARVQSFLNGSEIDWSRTQAFARGKEGDVFVNLRGRDPHGIVEPGRPYEALRDRLIACFSAQIDPTTGMPAVDRVYRAEELYRGPRLGWAPDLVVAWRDDAYMPTEDDRNQDQIFVPRWREYMNWPTSGSHRPDGVLIAQGPGIRKGALPDRASIIDLMPTWLCCLGQPVPTELEGRVLGELLESVHAADPAPAERAAE